MAEIPANSSAQGSAADRLAQAAAGLPEPLHLQFQRLGRELLAQAGSGSWRLFIGQYEHTREREQVAHAIETLLPGSRRVTALASAHPEWLALEAELIQVANGLRGAVIQVFGLEQWLDPLAHAATATRLRAANLRREAFTRAAPAAIVFWLREAQIRDWVVHAPDLWAWRSGVHRFVRAIEFDADFETALPRPFLAPGEMDNRTAEQRRARIDALHSHLEATAQQPDTALRATLLEEYAELLAIAGRYGEALDLRRNVLAPICVRLGDEHAEATNWGGIANILRDRGHLKEALDIRQELQLPICRRLGDEKETAVAQGKIADLLQDLGHLDAALEIRRKIELPVYQRLEDGRSVAVTQGKIADVLQAQGDDEESLRLRREVELPVYERLGDERAIALTRGKIADILQGRGQIDEALHIRRQELLPVFERLGDVRSMAATQFGIASALLARGDHATPEGFRAAFDSLTQAWQAVRQLQALDGMAAVGSLLAQMLAANGGVDRAREVLVQVDEAQALLGDERGRQRTAALRERLQAMADSAAAGEGGAA